MYFLVEFTEGDEKSIEVVPESWVEDGSCMWPPYKQARFLRAVRKAETPGADWEMFDCRIIYRGDTYEKVQRKVPRAEVGSNVDTTASEAEEVLRRKRSVPLRYADSDESSSECDDDAGRSAKLRKKSSVPPLPKAPLPPPFVETSQATLGNSSNDEVLLNIPSSVQPQTPVLQITPSQTLQATPFLAASITPDVSHFPPRNNSVSQSQSTPVGTSYSTHRSTSMINRSSRICSDTEQEILVQLESLHQQIQQQTLLMQQIASAMNTNMNGPVPQLPEDVDLPLHDVAEVNEFDGKLRQEISFRKSMVALLTLQGGGDLKETVWRMLAYLFTSPCAKLVNWSGVNQKLAFKNLKLKDVLFSAVRKHALTAKSTDRDIDRYVKRWFQLASDRDDGRKEREARKSSQRVTSAVQLTESP